MWPANSQDIACKKMQIDECKPMEVTLARKTVDYWTERFIKQFAI